MYRIGLTGGVGSGKSTVSSYMKELGIPVIDGDKLAREAVIPGSGTMNEIRRSFGPSVFNKDGTLNRARMGEVVFTNDAKREKLNSIIHPYIWNRTQQQLVEAQQEGHNLVVLDMPLLLELSWQLRVEEVWIVRVPLEIQIQRVMARDGFTRQQVLERIHKQMPTGNKLNYATVVIDNSHSVEDTRKQVRQALQKVPGFTFSKE
jgi:dephospho-CoA kinase